MEGGGITEVLLQSTTTAITAAALTTQQTEECAVTMAIEHVTEQNRPVNQPTNTTSQKNQVYLALLTPSLHYYAGFFAVHILLAAYFSFVLVILIQA